MSEVKKCPKCGGEMEEGRRLVASYGATFTKKGDLFEDKIIPCYCKSCGFIEIHKEMKE